MLTTLARQALQHVQDLIADLHPTVLETLGLEQALEMLANQKMRAHGLQITLALERFSQRLPPRMELALFRVAQDLLDRAINQARASHVLVQLTRRDDHLILTLADNGVGVTDETTLQSLRRQLEPVGGTVKANAGYRGSFEVIITLNIKDLADLNAREMELLQLLAEERKR
jgi:signal transduction histidine kinase